MPLRDSIDPQGHMLTRCPACHGQGDRDRRICYPCQATGRIDIIPPEQAEKARLEGVWVSIEDARKLIEKKRTEKLDRISK